MSCHVLSRPARLSAESDLIPGLVTFVACLMLALEIGIVIGIGTNLVFILYHAARPKISMQILKVLYACTPLEIVAGMIMDCE